MARLGLWLRWSWRDLRKRWLMVAAIALIIAIGTGVYAGFGSMAAWRRQSYDVNFSRQAMYDLRIRLSAGAFAPAGALRAAALAIPDARLVDHADERLILPVPVDASTPDRTILVPGELLGIDLTAGGPSVNTLAVERGRTLGPADSGGNIAVLHAGFARANQLPATGTVRLGGGAPVTYVGTGVTPDYFVITARAAGFVPMGNLPNYAVLFTSLATAQALSGRTAAVNDLVLTLRAGANVAAVRAELQAALAARLPDVSAAVLTRAEDEGRRILYQDIGGDQRLVDVLAAIVLGGAALAAFNLTSRLVESQRREIGVGMALGVRPLQLAIRPLLFATQVALLGVVLAVPVGLIVGEAIKPVFRNLLLLPVWQTPFQIGMFARAAALGFALPFLAAGYPILRAMRMQPIEAIRTGFLAASAGGLAPLSRRIPLPGRSFSQMPLRNLLRTPRRTVLTALAIGASVTALVAMRGLLDTFNALVDRGAAETTRSAPDRFDIQLDSFYPRTAAPVRALITTAVAARTDLGLRVEGTAIAGSRRVDLVVDLLDFADAMWTPTLSRRVAEPAAGGIVLAEKAAGDLGVRPGDTITLRHARREGAGYRLTETPLVVVALHPSPLRFAAYMDLSQAERFGLDGFTNLAQLRPAAGVSNAGVQRALFGQAGIALAQPVRVVSSQLKDVMRQFYDLLNIGEVAALALVLLIGFNATSIAADEGARQQATMFAFGLPVRVVLRMGVVENALLGLLGALLAIPAGFVVVKLVAERTFTRTLPELALRPTLAPATIIAACAVGVIAVAIGPLFTVRRLRRMDIPATLRVVE